MGVASKQQIINKTLSTDYTLLCVWVIYAYQYIPLKTHRVLKHVLTTSRHYGNQLMARHK